MKSYLLKHYITVAIRSLERYKTQSIISIVGLAVGFVCLSLSALWLRYDNTYNTSIPGYRDLYALGCISDGNFNSHVPNALETAMDEWPEVAAKSNYIMTNSNYIMTNSNVKGELTPCSTLRVYPPKAGGRPSLLDILPIDVVQGDPTFLEHLDETVIALTDDYARTLFGVESPVGQKLIVNDEEKTIVAIVRAFDPHTTFQFDLIEGVFNYYYTLPGAYTQMVVRLHPGEEVRTSFEKKLDEFRIWESSDPIHGRLIPITDIHQYDHSKNLSYAHMRAFLLISILLTACALINFLTLYLNRLRGRKREMALRLVHGSSHRGLVAMFTVELLVTLGSAIVLGMVGVFVLKDVFADFADIQMGGGFIMGRALLIMLGVLAVCLLLSLGAVEIVRRRTLSSSINPAAARRHVFSSASIGVQLAVSLCFVFCAVVMLRQVWFMKNTDMGARVKDVAIIRFESDSKSFVLDNGIAGRLAALPAVEDVVRGCDFFSTRHLMGIYVKNSLEEEAIEAKVYGGLFDPANPFYGFTVLEGTLPTDERWGGDEVVISESMRDRLGLKEAVGKKVWYSYNNDFTGPDSYECTVACVIKDVLTFDVRHMPYPLFVPRPTKWDKESFSLNQLNFSYVHGMKEEMKAQIDGMMKAFPEVKYKIVYGEESFHQMLKSEQNLSHLLTIVTLVAILIAVFGVYSIITLACRQRRKEIALRKIHGAKLKDILGMFVKEYGLILVIGAAVAFPVGYLIMHGWLEQYLKRITIGPLFYIGIFVATALLIALCVGARVWRTARENPADVVKSE